MCVERLYGFGRGKSKAKITIGLLIESVSLKASIKVHKRRQKIMSYQKQAKKCFTCKKANVHFSRASLRIYIQCPDPQCFDIQFKPKKL